MIDGAYRRLSGAKTASPADEATLAKVVAAQPEAVLEILDASLAPGTADQTRAAGLLSSHFGTTAHRMEQPVGGRATALGRIGYLRFRVKLEPSAWAEGQPGSGSGGLFLQQDVNRRFVEAIEALGRDYY